MLKQLILPMAAVAAFIVLVGFIVKNPDKLSYLVSSPVATQSSNQKYVTIGTHKVYVKIADTNATRQKGLGGTKSLANDEGMLFVFDSKNVSPIFWMKDMIMDIDIIWINDNKIVQIDKSIKAPTKDTPDSKLTLYKTSSVVDYVLEVNSGYSEKNNIHVGDSVTTP